MLILISYFQPTLFYSAPIKFDFILPYPGFFGGVTAVTPEQFLQANGFSNR